MDWAKGHWRWRRREYSECGSHLLLRVSSLAANSQVSEALAALSHTQPSLAFAANIASLQAHNQAQVVDREAVLALEKEVRDARRRVDGEEAFWGAVAYYLGGARSSAIELAERAIASSAVASQASALLGWIKRDRQWFSKALQLDKTNVDAVFGVAELVGGSEGLSLLNQVIVRHPRVVEPLLAKAELLVEARDWDQVLDTLTRASALQPQSITAFQLRGLKSVLEGSYDAGCAELEGLLEEVVASGEWWHAEEAVRALSVCCGRSPRVLAACLALTRTSPALNLTLAHTLYLSGDLSAANSVYKSAVRADNSSIEALIGLTRVQITQSHTSPQVEQQVALLGEVGGGGGELLYMRALVEDSEKVTLLDQAVAALQAAASNHKFGLRYLSNLNPDLLLAIAKAYPSTTEGEKKRGKVVQLVVETVPGLAEARLMLARSQLAQGDPSSAKETLASVEPTNPHAHLLTARILMDEGDVAGARRSLELGLSYNLAVREMTHYHLLSGKLAVSSGNDKEAVSAFRDTLAVHAKGEDKLSGGEVGGVYRELGEALLRLGEVEEARRVLGEAMTGDQEVRGEVTVALAELQARSGEPSRAISLLNTVPSHQPHFIQAQIKKAQIYLNYLKDGQAYAECYRKLVELEPNPENFILLGDAYLAIQEPELAVESYERAMGSGSSGSSKLSLRLARVLVRSHHYAKAIKAYRDAGEEGSLELAELLMKLGQTEKAEAALSQVPLSQKALVLAKVYEKGGDVEKALKTLESAEHSLEGSRNSELGARLAQEIGRCATLLRDFDRAIDSYKRSLAAKPDSPHVQIALAKLYMQVNDWGKCEEVCSRLVSSSDQGSSGPALLMLGELALRRVQLDSALQSFSALLAAQPNHWLALARIVEVLRRTARLPEAKAYLDAAARHIGSTDHPGLAYATGLYEWYSGRTGEALERFNEARGDAEWGQQAVHNMVEVWLAQGESSGAERLLRELKPSSPHQEAGLLLLASFVRLASTDKAQIERAMNDLTHLANHDAHKVGATLGLGLGYTVQKQGARARNVLKRVARVTWNFEEAEQLERAWLLLADLHLQASKHELALDLLHRVIAHNRSCPRAFELLGLIAEKEQKYLEASREYEEAWKLSREPALGYRLGYNLVKSKRYARAVAVAQAVLKAHPNYPRIAKEVLAKALNHLRAW